MANVFIVNHDVKTNVRGKKNIYSWLNNVATNEKKTIQSLTIILCSDEYLLSMNRKHLNHDYYTDVITFDLSDTSTYIVGEIYISVDRVKENAASLKQKFVDELHRVMVHGLLHLCGYMDKSSAQIKQMRNKEDFYLLYRKHFIA
ncbi:MAG: rRNA maturation RNase YbeY [Flavobacteriales bacterium]|nr:rRNA maturation RNase YbeY [Flavobacteriales bacterium]